MNLLAGCIIGLLAGIIIGGLSVKNTVYNESKNAINALSKIFSEALSKSNTVVGSLNTVVTTQGKLCRSLRRENKLLQEQLDCATEHISDLENIVSEGEGTEDNSDPSEDEPPASLSTKKEAVASDKLVTIKKLLEDASHKGESINPDNLLGIVNHKI